MSAAIAFLTVYDKVGNIAFADCRQSHDSYEVNEHEDHATMTKLNVTMPHAEFIAFDYRLVKNMKDFTEHRTTLIQDTDCDGLAFMTYNGQESIVATELKSRFSTQKIKYAFTQITFSFLKLHAMLSLCQDYDIDNMPLHFVVACKCFEHKHQEDAIQNILEKAKMADPTSFEAYFLSKLLKYGRITTTLGEIARQYGLLLNSHLAGKELTMSLQVTKNYADTSVTYMV